MIVNMVVKSSVYVVDFSFNPEENLLVLRMLVGVPSVEPFHNHHNRPRNNGNNNRNPPHIKSHPPLSHGLSVDTGGTSLGDLGLLTFLDGRPMEVLLAVRKS